MLAAQKTRSPTKLLLETDSQYAKNALCTHRDKHEDIGYIGIANRELIIPMVAAFRRRQTETKIRWVKAHAGHELNEGADEMAKTGAGKPHPDALDLRVPTHLTVTGAKLAVLTQKLAYQAIREAKMQSYQQRPRTVSNLERAKSEAEDANDCVASSAAITRPTRFWRGQPVGVPGSVIPFIEVYGRSSQ
jgi:ribonuclease HI